MSLPIHQGWDQGWRISVYLWFDKEGQPFYFDQGTHWLIGLDSKEKQLYYEGERLEYRKKHNIPDAMNVKGANVIPAKYIK